jgi:hypothetical protein
LTGIARLWFAIVLLPIAVSALVFSILTLLMMWRERRG